MSDALEASAAEAVDIAFALEGTQLPADYRSALWKAVAQVLPWMEDEPQAGIHSLKAVDTNYGVVLLPKRVRLTLRVPSERAEAAEALAGKLLDVAGFTLKVGECKVWQLAATSTLYADFVTTGSEAEDLFCRDIESELAGLGIPARLICGRSRTMLAGGRRITGFALALHSVPREKSRFLQQIGLGNERRLGCGVLVQHRAITGLD
ncbi:MAG: type I-MYXAN CRISPR-associated protein Cas6/Cmx6 [Rhodocyclaceae bacterium]|nr:type I-MYXAN CRISPR-associated protein Cas6/Cmx6 [Rhodocyclaceae bacterium]